MGIPEARKELSKQNITEDEVAEIFNSLNDYEKKLVCKELQLNFIEEVIELFQKHLCRSGRDK